MYFAKKRLIGKLIGVATAIFLVLSMMPGLAWGAEATDGSLPQEASTPSATVESPQTTTTDAAATTLPADTALGTGDLSQTAATGSAVISSDTTTVAATTNAESTSAPRIIPATTQDSLDLQLREQAQVRTLATDSIVKVVSIDEVTYEDVNPVTIGPGGTLYYRFYFTGQTTIEAVNITDTLPNGFKYIADTAKLAGVAKEPTVDGQQLKWTNLTVPHTAGTMTYEVTATNVASPGSPPTAYENTAKADQPSLHPSDPNAPPTLGSDVAEVIVTDKDLSVDKKVSSDGTTYSQGPVTVGPGDIAYFSLELKNNGDSVSDIFWISDVLPTGFAYKTEASGGVTALKIDGTEKVIGDPTPDGNAIAWSSYKETEGASPSNFQLDAGKTALLTFQATAGTTIGTFENKASVWKVSPTVGQVSAAAQTPVIRWASDVAEVSVGASLTKQVSVGSSAFADEGKVKQGEAATYKIVVTNPGDGDLADVRVVDTLPAGFTYVEGSTEVIDSDGAVIKDTTATDTDPSVVGQKLTWPKDAASSFTVEADKTVTITYKVTASKVISTTLYENLAQAFQGAITEVSQPFASDSTKITVVLKDVKKQVSTDGTNFSDEVSVAVNSIVRYKITVSNADASDVTVTVEDTLPAGFTYQTGTTTGPTTNNPAINGQKLAWSPITAVKNADTTLTFQAKAGSTIGDSNVNTVKVLKDTTLELGSDTANVKVTGTPTINITKTVDRSTTSPNDTLSYTINYSNTGTVALTNVVITDVVPASTTFVAGSASDSAVFDQNTNTITWTVGSVATGTSKSVSFKASVNPSATGTITNTASIDSNETDAKTASAITNVVVVLQTTTQQQPATLPQTGNPDGTQVAAQLPTTLPKTGLDLLGYLFGAVALVTSGLFLRRMGRDKR